MDKADILLKAWGKDWFWMIRLNTLYHALILKGLLTEEEFRAAREKSVDELYDKFISS